MTKLLVIDDDKDILELLKDGLTTDGHEVIARQFATEVDDNLLSTVDLILLDVMMPDKDGFTYCQEIRDITTCPIIFLTAKSQESEIIQGLSVGGDDYIVKPFKLKELRARIAAHLRRTERKNHHFLKRGTIVLNVTSKEIFVDHHLLSFTKSEYEICEYLAMNQGQVFTREQLLTKIYGYQKDSDINAITEHIKNIRSKFNQFGQEPIKTVWGVGYKWN